MRSARAGWALGCACSDILKQRNIDLTYIETQGQITHGAAGIDAGSHLVFFSPLLAHGDV